MRRSPLQSDDQSDYRQSVPTIDRIHVDVSSAERVRLKEIAARLLRDEPLLAETDVFGEGVGSGLTSAPALIIGDTREIGFHPKMTEQLLEHRIGLLVTGGDMIVADAPMTAFKEYLRNLLKCSPFDTVALNIPTRNNRTATAARCIEQPEVMDALVSRARSAGQYQILPHIGTGWSWMLAGEVSARAGVPVSVAAPPPRLSRRVNDKIWFAARLRSVLGPKSLPPTHAAFGPSAAAARIMRMAKSSETVIVKVPDGSGSLGNVAIHSDQISVLGLRDTRELILRLLRARGWQDQYPILTGVWEDNAVASPSVQIWIPSLREGDPKIEGFFEQHVSGENAAFVGAAPAILPNQIAERMGQEAMQIGLVLQHLGYFGRCSFDALLVGKSRESAAIHWIECNGRWGGVSLPMTLANRLFGSNRPLSMVVVQELSMPLAKPGFNSCLEELRPLLLQYGDTEGIVLLSDRVYELGTGVHFAAYAKRQERAEDLAREALQRLTGNTP